MVLLLTLRRIYLISSWLNLIFYTMEVALYALYMLKFRKDRPIHRWVVFAALISDTICTIGVSAGAYSVSGIPLHLTRTHNLVQRLFCYRMVNFSKPSSLDLTLNPACSQQLRFGQVLLSSGQMEYRLESNTLSSRIASGTCKYTTIPQAFIHDSTT